MITIKDRLNNTINECFLLESVLDKRVSMLIDAFKSRYSNLRNSSIANYKLDEIDGGQIIEYDIVNSKTIKEAKDALEHGDIVVLLKNDKIGAIIVNQDVSVIYEPGEHRWNNEFYNKWNGRASGIKNLFPICDSFWIIEGAELRNYNKRAERTEAKRGMIKMDEESFKRIAYENVERYKKIAAQIRANKSDRLEKINKEIQDLLSEAMKMSNEIAKNAEKFANYQDKYEIKGVFELVDNCVMRYKEAFMIDLDVKTKNSYNPDYDSKRVDDYIASIRTYIKNANEHLNNCKEILNK